MGRSATKQPSPVTGARRCGGQTTLEGLRVPPLSRDAAATRLQIAAVAATQPSPANRRIAAAAAPVCARGSALMAARQGGARTAADAGPQVLAAGQLGGPLVGLTPGLNAVAHVNRGARAPRRGARETRRQSGGGRVPKKKSYPERTPDQDRLLGAPSPGRVIDTLDDIQTKNRGLRVDRSAAMQPSPATSASPQMPPKEAQGRAARRERRPDQAGRPTSAAAQPRRSRPTLPAHGRKCRPPTPGQR